MRPIPLPRAPIHSPSIELSDLETTAVKKPQSLSSAQVIRDLQHKFRTSKTFQPLLQETERKENASGRQRSKRRKISIDHVFKMGHGGTLDPLATGVIIVGIGRGTKHLNDFLGCTKTYDTVVLFGKSTDTYDVAGRVVAESSASHVTRGMVEQKLSQFRGKIKQVPPIYSALKIDGMKAYDYARTGKELPRELESRDMEVSECEMLEWYDSGNHDYRYPAREAPEEEKVAARKLMRGAAQTEGIKEEPSAKDEGKSSQPVSKQPQDPPSDEERKSAAAARKAELHTHEVGPLSDTPADAPAARVRLSVSSGFYVRAFAHDLGLACGTFGIMSELARTRQGDYTSKDPGGEGLVPCLTYEELEDEEIWSPKISAVLAKWMVANPIRERTLMDDRDKPAYSYSWKGEGRFHDRSRNKSFSKRRWDDRDDQRRNSSSPD